MKSFEKTADFLVIGGGVAGLRAAIEIASEGSVIVLTKGEPSESSTGYAQGGIAVALSDEDEVGIHYEDTIKAGDGLCKKDAVRVLVEEGPERILELMSWGAEFDREDSKLSFTREAAHSRRRILHSQGDSTGREIERVLINQVRTFPSISRYDFAFTIDLIVMDNRCIGATVMRGNEIFNIFAKAVILATGGAGQLFSRTTNPTIATGDGMAIAYRAGALLADMEFIQFHPTTLYVPSAPQFLLSEAMRGEGAVLKNIHGKRFIHEYHEMEELAPRDAVTRAIVSEMVKTKAKHVYLDLTHLDKDFIKKRFPMIYATCLQFDTDITEDIIPVSPAAHYIMGGVNSNLNGETNIKGLFVAGEVACTGVHGANRLASNSLLEGLVYGARTGKRAVKYASHVTVSEPCPEPFIAERIPSIKTFDAEKIRSILRRLMWNKVGIIRCEKSLNATKKCLNEWGFIMEKHFYTSKQPSTETCIGSRSDRRKFELKNMLTVASLITDAARSRKGSIGAHYRSDFKERGENRQRHTVCQKGKGSMWID